ncbi:MAG: hypothetical protein K2X68_07150 [Novosphingobium sp.]|nr:hypothetical protein [Novosphingobium sp.]
MSFWSAIVAIVAIIAFANMRRDRHRIGAGVPDPFKASGYPYQTEPAANPALEREVIELRKRIEVLERIITDERESHRLAQDIEALREH